MADINAHMQRAGVANSRWYVGITKDIQGRLFEAHRVTNWYIYRQAITHVEARAIETAYHDAGCKGGPGGGDDSAVFVYAYIITEETVQ